MMGIGSELGPIKAVSVQGPDLPMSRSLNGVAKRSVTEVVDTSVRSVLASFQDLTVQVEGDMDLLSGPFLDIPELLRIV